MLEQGQSLVELPENELVELAKTDVEAFGELYMRYVDKIYSYIYYRTSNHQDAEDLTSRVSLSVVQVLVTSYGPVEGGVRGDIGPVKFVRVWNYANPFSRHMEMLADDRLESPVGRDDAIGRFRAGPNGAAKR